MVSNTAIPDDILRCLASGREDPEVTRFLINGQLGKRLLQLGKVAGQFDRPNRDSTAARERAEHYTLLAAIQRHSPGVIRSLLLDPDVGVWFANSGNSPVPIGLMAAAAAIQTGTQARIVAPMNNGELFLPTLGTAIFRRRDSHDGRAELDVQSTSVAISAGGETIRLPGDLGTPTDHWHPARWLELGTETNIRVLLADRGPLNAAFGGHTSAAVRSANRPNDLCRPLVEAWRILEVHHSASAAAIAACLRTIVPDYAASGWNNESGTLDGIFGAMSLGLPSRPLTIACNLVHEFQHAKLAALQDMVPLHAPNSRAIYHAPWRYDPRPLPAFLQGIYAHLGVSSFWNVQRHIDDHSDSILPHVEFARWSRDTFQACQSIVDDDHFTPVGRRFVKVMLDQLTEMCAEELPAEAAALAARIARDHQVSWRLRNLELDAELARQLASAWVQGRAKPPLPPRSVSQRTTPAVIKGQRIHLIYRDLFHGQTEELEASTIPADLAYIRGNYGTALRLYADIVVGDPTDLSMWAGLVLSASELKDYSRETLLAGPELLPAVFAEAVQRSREPLDPCALIGWLANVAQA